jgi:hypothetical protein
MIDFWILWHIEIPEQHSNYQTLEGRPSIMQITVSLIFFLHAILAQN